MPELPEVETVRRGLVPAMVKKRIVSAEIRRAGLRRPFPAHFVERLTGARLLKLGRRAKYLVAELSTGEALIMHLGMTGRFTVDRDRQGRFVHATGLNPVHDHVVFTMEDEVSITFNDPRRFGAMDLWPTDALRVYPAFDGLGPEPMEEGFSAAYLKTAFDGKSAPVKAALLDQKVVAGLGNIYVCEALFRSGVSPLRPAGSLSPRRLARLAACVRAVIDEAILAGGSSISDFAAADGASGYFQHHFRVYGREGEACSRCGRPVLRAVQAGRSSFYCRSCQR